MLVLSWTGSQCEALIVETAGALDLKNVTIAQLDVRGADIRRFSFDPACHVVSLIADSGTMLPLNFPCPFNILKSDEFSSVFLTPLSFGDGRRPIAL